MQDLYKLVAEHFGVDSVNQNDRFVNDLGADQLDIVQLAMLLEERLNIDILDEEIEELQTVQDMYECVTKKIK
jgi:acyl carrier protein